MNGGGFRRESSSSEKLHILGVENGSAEVLPSQRPGKAGAWGGQGQAGMRGRV